MVGQVLYGKLLTRKNKGEMGLHRFK